MMQKVQGNCTFEEKCLFNYKIFTNETVFTVTCFDGTIKNADEV